MSESIKEHLYYNFSMQFPRYAEKAVSYEEDSATTLVVKLDDGSARLYDDVTGYLRVLPRDSNEMTEDECRSEFGRRLQRILMLKNMTQRDLANETGISEMMISRYILGRNTPSYYAVDRIAKVLGCSTDEFRYNR